MILVCRRRGVGAARGGVACAGCGSGVRADGPGRGERRAAGGERGVAAPALGGFVEIVAPTVVGCAVGDVAREEALLARKVGIPGRAVRRLAEAFLSHTRRPLA